MANFGNSSNCAKAIDKFLPSLTCISALSTNSINTLLIMISLTMIIDFKIDTPLPNNVPKVLLNTATSFINNTSPINGSFNKYPSQTFFLIGLANCHLINCQITITTNNTTHQSFFIASATATTI